jgi:protein-tyrosine phosphatase
LAEGIFIAKARAAGALDRLDIDSCGTGAWHVGSRADPRSLAVAARHGIELPSVARQFHPTRDVARFSWFIAMDRSNARELIDRGAPALQVRLMRSFDPLIARAAERDAEVPDPYGWEADGFESVFRMLDRACEGLLAEVLTPRDGRASGQH